MPADPDATDRDPLPWLGRARRSVPAVAATLASGAVMTTGGYLFHSDGWAVAGPSMLPAGVLISIAFVLARKVTSPASTPLSWRRLLVTALVGLPSPGGNISAVASAAVSVVTLLAGAVMVVAGYAIAAWNLLVVPPLILAGGLVITVAFVIVARSDQARRVKLDPLGAD